MNADAPCVSSATGSRRVQASKKRVRPVDDTCNVACKTLERQLGQHAASTGPLQHVTDAGLPYRNMCLQETYRCYDQPSNVLQAMIDAQNESAKVTEIVVADGLLFVLCQSGSCTAFNRVSGRRLCKLNVQQNEVIRSLFYNRHLRCLIVVSVHGSNDYSSLTSRSIPTSSLSQGRLQDGTPVFDRLEYPSFVEFDDVNSKVLSYNAVTRTYAVFNLQDYRALYAFTTGNAVRRSTRTHGHARDQSSASNSATQGNPALGTVAAPAQLVHVGSGRVKDVKISRGMLLIIMETESAAAAADGDSECIPLCVLDIRDGTVLKELRHPIVRGCKTELAELFNHALVFKQEGQPLQILDLLSAKVDAVMPDFPTPSAFIFLWQRNCFLSLLLHSIGVWNLQGQQVMHFEDHSLLRPRSHASSVYINHGQDLIVSLCQPSSDGDAATLYSPDGSECYGRIHISSLLTGRCVARVVAPPAPSTAEERATKAALTNMTALFVDEEQHEVYTGTVKGLVHRWSS